MLRAGSGSRRHPSLAHRSASGMTVTSADPAAPPARLTAFMVAANYYSVVYLAAGALAVVGGGPSPAAGLGPALAWVYPVPPGLARLVLAARGAPVGRATVDTPAYRTWWLLTQLQMIFNRIRVLEELLRLIPGAYGLWLNLWGSRVSLLAFWSPGVVVADRYLLEVGRGAVLGARCHLGAHIVSTTPDGGWELVVAPVTIGAGGMVGALAAVGPGCVVEPHQTLPAGRFLGAFTAWRDSRPVAPAGGARGRG